MILRETVFEKFVHLGGEAEIREVYVQGRHQHADMILQETVFEKFVHLGVEAEIREVYV